MANLDVIDDLAPELHSRSGFDERTGIYHPLRCLGQRHRSPSDAHTASSFIFSHFPSAHSAAVALIDAATGRELTYAELRRSSLAFAAVLRRGLNVRNGDVVLLLASNSILYPSICLGVLAAGAVISTANPLNTAADIAKQAEDSAAALIIVAPEEMHKVQSLNIPILLTTGGNGDTLTVEELMEAGESDELPPSETSESDVAAVMYSSGTTGKSKGVVLTHKNIIAIMRLLKWYVEATSVDGNVYLGFIPMFHIYGLVFFALGLYCTGATTVVVSRFELHSAMAAVAKYKVTHMAAVPPVLVGMTRVASAGGGRWDLSSLRRVGCGAAPLTAEAGRAFRQRFPWMELRPGYGLTESGGAATMFETAVEAAARPTAVGRLLPGIDAKVVDVDSGHALRPGGEGELWLRGPTVMKEYLADDEATSAAFAGDGWLRTGDLVYFDEDGYLYVVDRIKELIKHKGYQVSPAELEALLLQHPQILDATVIPVEDEETGQIPMAFVVRSTESQLRAEEIIQFVAMQVAPYKKIRRVAFVNSIPRSPAGKILKNQLTAQQHQLISSRL